MRGYYNLGRVKETMNGPGSDSINDGDFKRPVVKLAPVLPEIDIFEKEKRAGDVVDELRNSTKLKSAPSSEIRIA